MKATIIRANGQSFIAKSSSNHWIALDNTPQGGGFGGANNPVELMLIACGGCVAMDVIHVVEKSRKQMTRFEMELEATRAESHPKVIREVLYHLIIEGAEITPDLIQRAINLSLTKYCSASLSLDRSVKFFTSFTLNGTKSQTWEIERDLNIYT